MGSVGQPPAVLGKMIGGALCGDLPRYPDPPYGFVAPIASVLGAKGRGKKARSTSASQGGVAGIDQVCTPGVNSAVGSEFRGPVRAGELEEDLKVRKGKMTSAACNGTR